MPRKNRNASKPQKPKRRNLEQKQLIERAPKAGPMRDRRKALSGKDLVKEGLSEGLEGLQGKRSLPFEPSKDTE